MVDHDPNEPDAYYADAGYDDLAAPALRRARRRRRRPGAAHVALKLATIVIALAIGVLGGGYVYLGHEPISLESLRPAITESLQSRLSSGYRVALGPIAISRTVYGVGIGFRGLAIRDSAGRLVVSAPGGRIGLDALALFALDVKVRRLELDGLQLALRVGANGELSLSAGDADAAAIALGPTPATPAANNFGALVAGLAEAMAGVDQPLDHAAIIDGKLTVQTAGREQPAVYDDLRLTFDRSGASASASLAARGPSGDWRIAARAQAGAARKLSVEAHQLSVDDFLRLDPHPPRFSFNSPISFDFTAAASPSGALTALDAAFSIGAGSFDPHDPDGAPPIAIDEATGKARLDDKGRYVLEKVEILAGATHVRLGGWLAPPAPGDLLWRAHLHSADSLFAAARPGDPAAVLDNVDIDAHFDPATKTFATDKFIAHGPQLSGQFAFGLHLAAAGPELKMDLQGQGSLLQALRLWPTFVNPDARKWCEENVRGGELASGSLKIDWNAAALAAVLAKQAPPADSVNGHFSLRNAAVDLLPGLPTTTGLDATGVITGRHFHVEAPRGVMELDGGRRLAGTNLSFTVPDTKPVARMPAEGAGHISGGADALADLLMRDALKRYVGVALDPNAIKGQFDGDLKLDLTLGKGVQPEDQKFHVTGNLSALAIDKFLGNTKLEQGALQLAADRSQLKMTGAGVVLGAPAKLEVTKIGQDVGALVLTGSLDEAARTKLGYTSGPRLRGPVTLKLKAPLDKSGADVEVDLAKATLESLGGAPWKAAGRPGKATFQLKATPEGGVQVNNLVIEAGALSGRGSAMFGPEGALKSLKLAPFRMGGSDDLKLDIEGGATTKVTLRGAMLDARGVVKSITAAQGSHDSQGLDLDVKVGAALGYNREQISGFEMTAARRNGAFTALDARGRFGQAKFSARSGDGGVLLIKSDDAGALARFLDVYGKLQGGVIELSVRQSRGSARGSATIRRFSIRDEPSLRQLQQAAPARQSSSRGSNSTPGAESSPPVSFDKLTANFTRVGGRLDVHNGVIASPAFGLTTQGFIDFVKDKVDLNGVFVPLQQFNNALGSIPLLGLLLTGGQNEGVFAINYRVTGLASNPTLKVNPLSGMTPGILRKLFGAIDGTTPSPDAADSPASSYAPTQLSR
ncbi:MAG TPA: DUF3971 domain-containing protein [Roseiarcus sp.]|nr:DUF3971 domain-containing protein [Roseiarcus sp.]